MTVTTSNNTTNNRVKRSQRLSEEEINESTFNIDLEALLEKYVLKNYFKLYKHKLLPYQTQGE